VFISNNSSFFSPTIKNRGPEIPFLTTTAHTSSKKELRALAFLRVVQSPAQKLLQANRQSSRSFAARGDVFPCKVCGEVLGRPQLLELHQAM
jgi:hypothetical protein